MKPAELQELIETINNLPSMPNVTIPNHSDLRREAEQYAQVTEFGNHAFASCVKNRSAGLTVYIGEGEIPQKKLNSDQESILRKLPKTLEKVRRYLEKAPLYQLRLTMGDNSEFTPHCTMFLSRYKKECCRLAYMAAQTLFERSDTPGPEMTLIDIPEWQEKDRQILVFPDERLTLVLGSDYYGEVKKGFLRMAMWEAKKRGMLGLHAGSKMIRAMGRDGKLRRIGMIIFGLTATGKTTHSCHNHDLDGEGEGVEIVQDDVVFLHKDGSALGSERGYFIKTDGLTLDDQPLLYHAASQKDALFENVLVDYQGKVYFQDETLTGNGRGIIQRRDLGDSMSPKINLPSLKEMDKLIVAFITRRNTVLPIATRLTPAQAAGAFMLGESIESTGGDPKRAGDSVRVVGTNPFIIGDESTEGNWFYDFLMETKEKVECYQLNTGGVGEIMERLPDGTKKMIRKVTRVEISEMASIIRGICRETIDWIGEPNFETMVPRSVEGADLDRLDPLRFYEKEEVEKMVRQLRKERVDYMLRFKNLNKDILDSYTE
ncbi:MAG: phosphoenolpyruvate carboxykinase (GTP) [Methanomassiliicoccales archaeon]|nr:phosphoenolpyruvate carboxykinase (GTP) [Methanomassiliicoccales archaeon]NYT14526.1 phosphoenolpyruvate carboxykinase (GTP) [Methanomassiliicoccales archaeon]